MSKKKILQSAIMQESLINKKATIKKIDALSDDINIGDIYFGTGVCNPSELSCGIPFDTLLYPLIANKLRNKLNKSGHVHHLVADNHAHINNFAGSDIKRISSIYRNTLEQIVSKLGIENYHIYLSSEIATDNNYKAILDRVKDFNFPNQYSKFEATDIEYFHTTRDVLLKLGWKFNGASNFDESNFDAEYEKAFGNNIVPIYTSCGKKFTDTGFDSVPYTVTLKEKNVRILIDKDENIPLKVSLQKCTTTTLKMLENHYKAVIRLLEELLGRLPINYTIWEKLQYVNQLITT